MANETRSRVTNWAKELICPHCNAVYEDAAGLESSLEHENSITCLDCEQEFHFFVDVKWSASKEPRT